MGKQLEKFKQTPMRPGVLQLELGTADFTPISDAGAVDWTVATTRLGDTSGSNTSTVEETRRLMDDHNRMGVAADNRDIEVREGQYEVAFECVVSNTDTAADHAFKAAITNGSGSTVHLEGPAVEVPASGTMTVSLKTMVHLTSVGVNTINFRAVQNEAGTDLAILQGPIGYVKKIGNVNEA